MIDEVLNHQAQSHLKAIIERVERVAAKELELREEKKDIYAEIGRAHV